MTLDKYTGIMLAIFCLFGVMAVCSAVGLIYAPVGPIVGLMAGIAVVILIERYGG